MVATPLRWAYFALPAPAQRIVRAARERARTPQAPPVATRSDPREIAFSEESLARFAEAALRLGVLR